MEQFVRKIEHCKEFYLCLYSDWDSVSSHILALTDNEEAPADRNTVLLKFALKNGKRLPECSYRKKNLLPDYIYDSSVCAYIYIPLFFEEREFGYLNCGYSFTLPAEMLLMIYFEQKQNTIRIGTTEIATPK